MSNTLNKLALVLSGMVFGFILSVSLMNNIHFEMFQEGLINYDLKAGRYSLIDCHPKQTDHSKPHHGHKGHK